MAYYVLANMEGAAYDFSASTIVGAIVGVLAIAIGETTVSESDA